MVGPTVNTVRTGWTTSPAEKRAIAARLAGEQAAVHRAFWPALLDPRVIALGLVYIGFGMSTNGIRIWLPQIVQEMGFSNRATGFVVALPYVASMGAMILWGRSSDARGERTWHLALALLLVAGGAFAVGQFLFSSDEKLSRETVVLVSKEAKNVTQIALEDKATAPVTAQALASIANLPAWPKEQWPGTNGKMD